MLETHQDRALQKLSQTIREGNWQTNKNVDLARFYPIRDEIYEAQGLIFRMERIVLPVELQHKVIKSAHKLGHLGTTKMKQVLRAKYWFPGMNAMIDQMIAHCFHCQVTNKDRRQEPIKPSVIPKEPWEEISIAGHYNLVAIDQRTRYPEVEVEPNKEKLKKIFAHHGVPKRARSDNGPPFNSKEFANFAKEEGFDHHRVTPQHPRANGQMDGSCKC